MLKLSVVKAETIAGDAACIWHNTWHRWVHLWHSRVAVPLRQLSVNCYLVYLGIKQSEAFTLKLLYFKLPFRNITDIRNQVFRSECSYYIKCDHNRGKILHSSKSIEHSRQKYSKVSQRATLLRGVKVS